MPLDRPAFTATFRARLGEFDRDLRALTSRVVQAGEGASLAVEAALATLPPRRAAVGAEFARFQAMGEAATIDRQRELAQSYLRLRAALREVAALEQQRR